MAQAVVKVDDTKKMRILCLHGFRTNGAFLQKQLSKWDPSIFQHFDLDFPNGLFPCGGKSDIEGIFPGPYFEWFQFNKEFTEYINLEECLSHLCEYITTKGPFDGLLGFSQAEVCFEKYGEVRVKYANVDALTNDFLQGATLSALILGYQAQGKILKEHPPMKLFVSVSGSKFRDPAMCEIAYKDPINVKSAHFIGAKDWLKMPSEDLATAFISPIIIRHPQGHTVPRLDEEAVGKMRAWTTAIIKESDNKEDLDIKQEVKDEQVKDTKHEGRRDPKGDNCLSV